MKLNVVLFEPEIPENTGNIARSCVGFNATLHLIRPYGFILSNQKLKRSGVDYWQYLDLKQYDCFDDFLKQNNYPKLYIYTRYGFKKPNDFSYDNDQEIFLMFGKESSGIPKEILSNYKETLIRIPTSNHIRSLNLSNTVAIALYEVVKQLDYNELENIEPHKKDYWK